MKPLRGIFLAVATLVALAVAAPAVRAAPTGVAVVDLDGRGFGHGVGLSQWGAKYMADAGASHADILSTFYPGTDIGSVGNPEVRVAVYSAPDGRVTFVFPNGGEVRSARDGDQAPGFPVAVAPGGSVIVTYDGSSYRVSPGVSPQAASKPAAWRAPEDPCIPLLGPCDPTNPGCGLGCPTTTPPPTTAPPPTDTQPPDTPPPDGAPAPTDPSGPHPVDSAAVTNAPVWAVPDGGVTTVAERDRRYRGLLEATAGGGPLRVVNQLDVDSYLKGMGEVPGEWPIEAVSAQAVAARTYALRAMASSGELCDYDLCQVYIGAARESAGQSAAVEATRGEVVTYAGALASTVYSADAGGVSATTLEGFGTPDGVYPYLTTVRYDTPDPLPWHTQVSLNDVASRLGYRGQLQSISIGQAGPSGRALELTLDGSSGPASVSGRQFAASLGLRSTLFTPVVGTSEVAPAAPPSATTAGQVLPDDANALHRAALDGELAKRAAASDAGRAGALDGQAAARRIPVPSIDDLTRHLATWIALGLLVLVSAAAMSAWGGDLPVLATWTTDVRASLDDVLERRGQRALRRQRAVAAAVEIPPLEETSAARVDDGDDPWDEPLFDAFEPPGEAKLSLRLRGVRRR
jgi:SpoIID/LytB domain protein